MARLHHIPMGSNGDYFLNYIDYSKMFDAGCLEVGHWQCEKWSHRFIKKLREKLKCVQWLGEFLASFYQNKKSEKIKSISIVHSRMKFFLHRCKRKQKET